MSICVSRSHTSGNKHVVLELVVNNHPGVMSHICGLFSRRAFNVEGILCMPLTEGIRSRIWLVVNEERRLSQLIKQISKLQDVLSIQQHGTDHDIFVRIKDILRI